MSGFIRGNFKIASIVKFLKTAYNRAYLRLKLSQRSLNGGNKWQEKFAG
jgi:hypothetical protein